MTYAGQKELLNFLDQQRTHYADVAFVLPDKQVKQEKTEVQNSVVKSKSKQQYSLADVRKPFNLAAKIIRNFANPSIDRVEKLMKMRFLKSDQSTRPTWIYVQHC